MLKGWQTVTHTKLSGMSKKIIVTGTSRGIGLQLVQQLVREGHQVLALSRKEDAVKALNFHLISHIQQILKRLKLLWKRIGVR